jgi:hypothetical protein
VASTTVSSVMVAGVDSGEVGRSADYRRYDDGAWTLHGGAPALTKESSVYSVSTFTRKCLLYK